MLNMNISTNIKVTFQLQDNLTTILFHTQPAGQTGKGANGCFTWVSKLFCIAKEFNFSSLEKLNQWPPLSQYKNKGGTSREPFHHITTWKPAFLSSQ